MSETVQLEDTSAVINALSIRVRSLERALERQAEEHRAALPDYFADMLRWMRKRGVIPLYVGQLPDEEARKYFAGDELISDEAAHAVLEQVWFLKNAPVSDEAKDALCVAAKNGMCRW